MSNTSTNIAWLVTLAAAFGGIWLLKRSRQSNIPSLVNNGNMNTYPNYDLRQYGEKLTRGWRNNNPLNIDQSGNAWQGKVKPSQDKRFETFVSLPYGYRAAIKTMQTYIRKYGLNTIYKIINRWAPAEDSNNPVSYTNNVCKIINERLGGNVTPDTVVSVNSKDLLTKMAYAMSLIENGDKEYARMLGLPNMDVINIAWGLI